MQTALEDAVDGLYAAFADRKRPTAIDYCTHCVDPGTVKRLLAPGPLREIPVESLWSYTVDVLSTAGGVADFRYFLPRILHIAVTDGFGGWPDLGLLMRKIRMADRDTWSAREQQAVTAFTHALWSATLTRFPADPDAAEVLTAIGELDVDLSPYLRAWEAALATHAGASHLLEFVRYHAGYAGTESWLGGLSATVAATAEAVTDEQTHDVLLEVLVSL